MSTILTNYLVFTRTTAIYPEHSDEPVWVYYLPLGLNDEAGELLEKVLDFAQGVKGIHKPSILAEIGDVLWYVARLADSLHVDMDYAATTEYTGNADLVVAAGSICIHAAYIAGRAKKIIRTDAGREAKLKEIANALGRVLASCRAVCRYFDSSLEEVAYTNQQKLSDRKDRGVLQGDGDQR